LVRNFGRQDRQTLAARQSLQDQLEEYVSDEVTFESKGPSCQIVAPQWRDGPFSDPSPRQTLGPMQPTVAPNSTRHQRFWRGPQWHSLATARKMRSVHEIVQ